MFLEREDGTRVDGKEEMSMVVYEYFSKVFVEAGRVTNHSTSASSHRVTRDQNLQLVREVTFEEFTKAIHQLHPNKASGSHGLNPTFYFNFWSVMGI